MGVAVVEGRLENGLPYLSWGDGPPLVVLPGLTPEHVNATGFERRLELKRLAPVAERFRIWQIQRKPGLAEGVSISDLAGFYAEALAARFDGPVPVEGVSTGGSIALQLAIDHPELVSRLVLVAAACRLSDHGRQVQRTLAELSKAGRNRAAWAHLARHITTTRLGGRLLAPILWIFGESMSADDPSDMLVTLAAEDAFDVSDDLGRVEAPTLVVGGERDQLYTPELFRATAEGIPQGRLLLCRGKGHVAAVADADAAAEVLRFFTEEGDAR